MDKKGFKKEYFYKGLTTFLVVCACVLFFFGIYKIGTIFEGLKTVMYVMQPIIFGFAIAYMVNPIVNFFNRVFIPLFTKKAKKKELVKKAVNGASVLLSLIIFTVIISAIIYLVIPEFYKSIASLVETLPNQIDKLVVKVTNMMDSNKAIKDWFVKFLESEKAWLQQDVAKYAGDLASGFATGVISIIEFLKNVGLGLLIAIYFLYNKTLFACQFRKAVAAIFKPKTAKAVNVILGKTHSVFSGFINGKVLDSLIIGVLCFIGVSILGIPYPMLIAVIVGVTNVIPFFGPFIGGIPCAVLVLLTNPLKGLYFIIFIILLQALDGNFIGPKILGDKTGLSSFWVIFAIILCGGLFGIGGMIIGVPAFAVLYYFLTYIINARLKDKGMPTESDYYTETAALGEEISQENGEEIKEEGKGETDA